MIREATIWDAQDIVGLWVKMQKELNLPFVRLDEREEKRFFLNIIAQIEMSDGFVAVSDNGEINGFINGKIIYRDYGISEPIATCEGAYIEPRGDGMELIKAFEEWAEVSGVRHIMFETAFDKRLPKIWGRRGYKAVQITYHRED